MTTLSGSPPFVSAITFSVVRTSECVVVWMWTVTPVAPW